MMNSQSNFSMHFLILTVTALLGSVVNAKDKEGFKGTWLHCDGTGIGFELSPDIIAKAFGCAAPHLMDIAKIKDWSPEAIDKSNPDLVTKLVHCLIKKLDYIDDKTGKVLKKGPGELSVALLQENIRKQFMAVANDCNKKHAKSMTKEATSFKGYVRCFEYSKLGSACPNHGLKPGNKFDASKFAMLG